jgi:hypothetical protein
MDGVISQDRFPDGETSVILEYEQVAGVIQGPKTTGNEADQIRVATSDTNRETFLVVLEVPTALLSIMFM